MIRVEIELGGQLEVVFIEAESKSKAPLFSIDQRISLIKESLRHLPNVVIKSFNGLLIDFKFYLLNSCQN